MQWKGLKNQEKYNMWHHHETSSILPQYNDKFIIYLFIYCYCKEMICCFVENKKSSSALHTKYKNRRESSKKSVKNNMNY